MLPRPNELTLCREPPVEVVVLTGFLGTGKTTLLRRLLAHAEFADAAVIINEFGSEPLDHLLVEHGADVTSVISGGCLCCLPPERLISLMGDMMRRQYLGELPQFRRLVIETSGLADPAPLLQSFASDPLRLSRYKLRCIVTTLDARDPGTASRPHGVGTKQLAAADIVVLTKTDLVAPGEAARLMRELEALSPAPLLDSGEGAFLDRLLALMADTKRRPMSEPDPLAPGHRHDGPAYAAVSRRLSRPIDATRLVAWLDDLAAQLGPRLLRLKGVVEVAGLDRALEIQGCGGYLFPFRPSPIPARGAMVIIVETNDAEFADARLRALAETETPARQLGAHLRVVAS
ncbi:MAG TPA: GTP-binding protein [Dongiaceae bacterium]